jgi:hypothetical protein
MARPVRLAGAGAHYHDAGHMAGCRCNSSLPGRIRVPCQVS